MLQNVSFSTFIHPDVKGFLCVFFTLALGTVARANLATTSASLSLMESLLIESIAQTENLESDLNSEEVELGVQSLRDLLKNLATFSDLKIVATARVNEIKNLKWRRQKGRRRVPKRSYSKFKIDRQKIQKSFAAYLQKLWSYESLVLRYNETNNYNLAAATADFLRNEFTRDFEHEFVKIDALKQYLNNTNFEDSEIQSSLIANLERIRQLSVLNIYRDLQNQ